jgi:hypothetical protein
MTGLVEAMLLLAKSKAAKPAARERVIVFMTFLTARRHQTLRKFTLVSAPAILNQSLKTMKKIIN